MHYALIRAGRVENIIVADQDFAALIAPEWDAVESLQAADDAGLAVAIGWGWQAGEGGAPATLTPPAPIPQPAPVPAPRHITQLAFLSRFTDPEAIAIDLASIGATQQAAAMRRYLSKVNAATYIDLDRPDTRAGVLALEAAGILSAGRALVILDAPIADQERPVGSAA